MGGCFLSREEHAKHRKKWEPLNSVWWFRAQSSRGRMAREWDDIFLEGIFLPWEIYVFELNYQSRALLQSDSRAKHPLFPLMSSFFTRNVSFCGILFWSMLVDRKNVKIILNIFSTKIFINLTDILNHLLCPKHNIRNCSNTRGK